MSIGLSLINDSTNGYVGFKYLSPNLTGYFLDVTSVGIFPNLVITTSPVEVLLFLKGGQVNRSIPSHDSQHLDRRSRNLRLHVFNSSFFP